MSDPSLSPAAAAAEVVTFGSTVIRDAWRLDHLAVIRDGIVRYLEARNARVQAGQGAPSERMYHTHGAGTFGMLTHDRYVDVAILADMFRGSDYEKICQIYFDDDQFWVGLHRLAFRSHDPRQSDRSFVPFHQDSGSQDPAVKTVLNCWIPLDPGCGREAPGLEVVRTPSEPGFPLKDFGLRTENAAYDYITIDRQRVEAEYAADLLAPAFDVGDGFVFSQDVIHRTHVTPQMTKPRMNFEFRVFSMKHLTPGASEAELRARSLRLT